MLITDKQRKFIEAYLLEPNGTKAAIKAGYAKGSAAITATKLLRHANVVAELDRRRARLSIKTEITPDLVLAELAKLGFADIRQVMQWESRPTVPLFDAAGNPVDTKINEITIVNSGQLSPEAAAAIAEISQSRDGTIKVKMHDKLSALVRLGQHLGMFRAPVGAPQSDDPGKKAEAVERSRTAAEGTPWEGLLQ